MRSRLLCCCRLTLPRLISNTTSQNASLSGGERPPKLSKALATRHVARCGAYTTTRSPIRNGRHASLSSSYPSSSHSRTRRKGEEKRRWSRFGCAQSVVQSCNGNLATRTAPMRGIATTATVTGAPSQDALPRLPTSTGATLVVIVRSTARHDKGRRPGDLPFSTTSIVCR